MRKYVRSSRGNTAEFAVCLSIFFMMIFFPLVDLVGLATGAASVCLTAHQCAIRSATQQRFDDALSAMQQEARILVDSGFGRFAHLQPVGGYQGSGADLYIVATEFRAKQITTYGPNSAVPPPVDTLDNVYECTSKVTFDIGPTISMANVPVFANVPGLGKPWRMTLSASRAAEYPEGLEASRNVASRRGAANLKPDIPWAEADNSNGSAWNYPTIYNNVVQAGQTVINEDVIQVRADNPNWTLTGLDIAPGTKIWIDYRADGQWVVGNSMVDADGLVNDFVGSSPRGSLMGKVGNSQPFTLGKQQWNFVPPGTGQLSLICNDDPSAYSKNSGLVNVRIVIAQ